MEPAAQDAAPAPQARADPRRGGPDPRLARLQGGGRAVRVLPEGRAVPGVGRGAPPAGRWGSSSSRSTAGSACSCAATSSAGASRSSWRSPGAVQRGRCASASSRCSWSGSTAPRSTTTCRSARRSSARIFFTVHVEPGVQIPEVPYEELEQEVERLARTWDDDLRDALSAGSAASAARALADGTRRASPSTTSRRHRLAARSSTTSASSSELEATTRGSSSVSGTSAAGERLTRVKLYKTGGKVELSAFMPILEALGLRVGRGGARPAARRGARSTSTTSASWTRAARCSTSRTRRPRASRRSSRCGAARPRSTR